MKLYEELLSSSEVSKLVTLVNDLRAAGRRGQLPGKLFILCLECGTCQLSLDLDKRKKFVSWHLANMEKNKPVSLILCRASCGCFREWSEMSSLGGSFFLRFILFWFFGIVGVGVGMGWIGDEKKVRELANMEKKQTSLHLFYLEHLVSVSVNDLKRPPWVLAFFYASFFGILCGVGWGFWIGAW